MDKSYYQVPSPSGGFVPSPAAMQPSPKGGGPRSVPSGMWTAHFIVKSTDCKGVFVCFRPDCATQRRRRERILWGNKAAPGMHTTFEFKQLNCYSLLMYSFFTLAEIHWATEANDCWDECGWQDEPFENEETLRHPRQPSEEERANVHPVEVIRIQSVERQVALTNVKC